MRQDVERSGRARAVGVLLGATFVIGCAPSTGVARGRGDGGDTGGDDMAFEVVGLDGGGIPQPDLHFDNDAFWENDPPLMYCALDGGSFPPVMPPGGTPECPDDKNREGCPCPTIGMTAACWPGLRANRGLGQCQDGVTTCMQEGELGQGWGPCMGYVLPDPNATIGAAACKCFSMGRWALDNLSPCLYDSGGGPGSAGATSSVLMGNTVACTATMLPLTLPNMPWSNDTITADCEGHFKLCYALKAGDYQNPGPNDCLLVEACTEGDYTQVSVAQPFPPLPAWKADAQADIACAVKFATTGGYGEMRVDGETITCDAVVKVFNRVGYCPLSCNTNPNDPMCKMCSQGGGGNF